MVQKSLKKQVLNGIAWRGSTDIMQQVLQVVFTIILARLLTKGDFGLVAMALIVNRFFVAITNIGFGGAIIRSPDINEGQISAVFYIQLAINIVLTLAVFLLAGQFSNFFDEPKLTELIQVTAWIIFLKSFQFPTILMRKTLKFKSFSIIEISSMIIANTVAIVMAYLGYGFWALVFRLILQKFCFSVGTWFFFKWRPTTPSFKGLKPIVSYGFNMLGSNLLSYFSENLVAILISKFLGKETMGLFSIAYNLAVVPATKIKSILLSVLTPGFAKIQLNEISFAKNNTKVLLYLAVTFMPFMVVISAMSSNIIMFLYGEKWIEAGNMLLILALVGLIKGMTHLLRSSILVKGKARIILIATFIEIMFSLPTMYFAISHLGVYGLLLGYCVGAIMSSQFIIYHYDRLFVVPIFYKTVRKPIIISASIFILVYVLGMWDLNLFLELTIQLLGGVLLYNAFIRKYYRSISEKLIQRLKPLTQLKFIKK